MWGISSVGRALAWHARGHQFKSGILHHFYRVLFSSDRSAGVEPSLFFCPAALSACVLAVLRGKPLSKIPKTVR